MRLRPPLPSRSQRPPSPTPVRSPLWMTTISITLTQETFVSTKRQFYSLSKNHHPDHNPNDPEAANRFVKISEAYSVLGNSENRERYDRERRRFSEDRSPRSEAQYGSLSSSGPFGSRPASGLSRRRTHFRGPPPSFYRGGGWGSQAAKRTAHVDPNSPMPPNTGFKSDDVNGRNTGSSGFSGTYGGWNNDVPHFDHEGHYRTHRWQEQKRIRRNRESPFDSGGGGAIWTNFFVVSGVISLAFLISTTLQSTKFTSNKRNTDIT